MSALEIIFQKLIFTALWMQRGEGLYWRSINGCWKKFSNEIRSSGSCWRSLWRRSRHSDEIGGLEGIWMKKIWMLIFRMLVLPGSDTFEWFFVINDQQMRMHKEQLRRDIQIKSLQLTKDQPKDQDKDQHQWIKIKIRMKKKIRSKMDNEKEVTFAL